ncbi:MAG: hypothetical protein GF307_00300 [candidate division Zixibacteria bacterium]|nr:hypothetical protein [candidate division Zixibacteria bacterium]
MKYSIPSLTLAFFMLFSVNCIDDNGKGDNKSTQPESPGIITGTVRDARTGQPIAGANFEFDNPVHYEIYPSDSTGQYRVPTLQTNGHLTCFKAGYSSLKKSFSVQLGETTTLDFRLTR